MKMNWKFFLDFLAGGISLINLLLPVKLSRHVIKTQVELTCILIRLM